MTERLFLTGPLQTPHGGVPAVSPPFSCHFLTINSGFVFTGVTSYQQLVALVAETYIIGKYPAFVAHILNEHHFMVLEHLFLFGTDFGTHDSVVDLQLFAGLLECDVHYSRIDESNPGKQRVVFALYVVDGKLAS